MQRHLIDTNLLLRFLLNDIPSQAQSVANLLKNPPGSLILTDVAFAELAWVMVSFYQFPKVDIIEKLFSILNMDILSLNKPLLSKTLKIYSENQIDYIDAYHAAVVSQDNLDSIFSFDKDFDKISSIKRQEP